MARLSGGRVVAEWESLTRPQLERLVHRGLSKLGNPVLHIAPDGSVQLFVVSVSVGGWAGSGVNHLRSGDGGRTWLSARRLVLSPFLNLSTLVRTPPVPLDDGSILLPAYHEFLSKWGMSLRVAAGGQVVGVSRIRGEPGLLQPAVAPLDSTHAVALLRSASASRPRVFRSATGDAGATWSRAAATEIPNADNSVALVRLADGRLLAAANPSETAANTLALLVSDDGGGSWGMARTVESSRRPEDQFRYPALAQSPDGTINMAYSVNRKAIRVRSLPPSALRAVGGAQEAVGP
jgi:predicted neuraminidase